MGPSGPKYILHNCWSSINCGPAFQGASLIVHVSNLNDMAADDCWCVQVWDPITLKEVHRINGISQSKVRSLVYNKRKVRLGVGGCGVCVSECAWIRMWDIGIETGRILPSSSAAMCYLLINKIMFVCWVVENIVLGSVLTWLAWGRGYDWPTGNFVQDLVRILIKKNACKVDILLLFPPPSTLGLSVQLLIQQDPHLEGKW